MVEILQISIDVGQGQFEKIIIREHDSPSDLAFNFCRKFGLNQQMQEILTEQFRQKIDDVRVEQAYNYQNEQQQDQYNYDQDAEVETDPDENRPNISNINNMDSYLKGQHHNMPLTSRMDNFIYSQGKPTDYFHNRSVTPIQQKHKYKHQELSRSFGKGQYSHRSPSKYDSGYNAGIRLYLKGVKKQEELVRQAQEAKIMKEMKEQELATFKPTLQSKQRYPRDTQGRPEEYLINYGRIIQEKHTKLRQEYQMQEEMMEFRPKINKKSELMVQEKNLYCGEENVESSAYGDTQLNKQFNKCNQLYEEGIKRQRRQEKLQSISIESECTFKPKLISKRRVSNGGHTSADGIKLDTSDLRNSYHSDVFSRMYEIAQHKKERIDLIKQMQSQNIDPKTGKPYFRPQTGRSPITRPDSRHSNIGDHLYEQHKIQKERQLKLQQQQDNQIREMQNKGQKQNKVSKQLIEQKQRLKIGEIFDVFDSDHDNQISSKCIDITKINAEILEIFSPLLCEMEKFNEALDKEEFIESGLKLYQVLTVHQRSLILKFKAPELPKQQTISKSQNRQARY